MFYQGDDPLNEKVMTVFASGKSGRLMGRGILFKQYDKISTPGQCASYCNQYKVTKCLSFNYDFSSGNCELLEAIEGHDFKLSTVKSKLIFIFLYFVYFRSVNNQVFPLSFFLQDGHYTHYEKLGVGSNRGFEFNNLKLQHNKLYFLNVKVRNSLGFQNILSSKPIIVDFTPPDPTECEFNVLKLHINV